jgi:hypothetical protein
MYIASVLSGCCIYCSGYTRMLQTYVSLCFSMLQQGLLFTRSDSWASTCCIGASALCSLSRIGVRTLCSLSCKHLGFSLILRHAHCFLSLARMGVRVLCSFSLACNWAGLGKRDKMRRRRRAVQHHVGRCSSMCRRPDVRALPWPIEIKV